MAGDAHPKKGVKVYVGIGSNIGDRWEMLRKGVQGLKEIAEGGEVEVSPIYETQPWGPIQQGPYLNGVVRFRTQLSPFELQSVLMEIEQKVGRIRGLIRYGPRELDLDILLYGDQIVRTLQLEIPHPR
ncbi:MAG: 2-amino-4-hydroxy-6-hydroxymethyldihydropteridine diphosphokinase, partial [bacterium]